MSGIFWNKEITIVYLNFARKILASGKNFVFFFMTLMKDYAGQPLKRWRNICGTCGRKEEEKKCGIISETFSGQ